MFHPETIFVVRERFDYKWIIRSIVFNFVFYICCEFQGISFGLTMTVSFANDFILLLIRLRMKRFIWTNSTRFSFNIWIFGFEISELVFYSNFFSNPHAVLSNWYICGIISRLVKMFHLISLKETLCTCCSILNLYSSTFH